jgi:tetratricopeptide (TPR) repeat protein
MQATSMDEELNTLRRASLSLPESSSAWAAIQNRLGTALVSRFEMAGRTADLEQAIAAYQAALSVYTREAFPEQWTATQNNLGTAFARRFETTGRATDLEQAIAAYQAALSVYTREAFPEQWAATQNNLGTAFARRFETTGRATDLEQAIAAYQAALSVYTREAFPEQWAAIQNNLGNAYRNRNLGGQAANLEQAIAAYKAALRVRSREVDPLDWAMTQNNLGNSWLALYKAKGDLADLGNAIIAFRSALEMVTALGTPYSATLLSNLGNALLYRFEATGEIEDLEQAIEALREASSLTSPGSPAWISVHQRLAEAQYHLGSLLVQQGRWYDGLRLLEESLTIRRQGNDLNARADTIYQIARTHHLMGNLDEARIRYRDALRLYDRTDNQRGVAACKTGLGRLTIQTGWLDDATHELEQARQIYAELDDEQRVAEIEEVLHLANRIKEKQPI